MLLQKLTAKRRAELLRHKEEKLLSKRKSAIVNMTISGEQDPEHLFWSWDERALDKKKDKFDEHVHEGKPVEPAEIEMTVAEEGGRGEDTEPKEEGEENDDRKEERAQIDKITQEKDSCCCCVVC